MNENFYLFFTELIILHSFISLGALFQTLAASLQNVWDCKHDFPFMTSSGLFDVTDLPALYLCGTYCHKTGTTPLAVKLLDNRLYISTEIFNLKNYWYLWAITLHILITDPMHIPPDHGDPFLLQKLFCNKSMIWRFRGEEK